MGCDIHGYVEKQLEDGTWKRHKKIFNFRNYRVFAGLADVRNGCGGFKPLISLAGHRGLPEDCTITERVLEDTDYHSFSWATLEDTQVLSREVYEKWDRRGLPERWSWTVEGPSVNLYDEHQIKDFPHWTHVRVQFSWPLRQACQFFLDWCENIYKRHADKKLRLVFWFDN